MKKLSRREVVKGVIAAGAIAVTGGASAEQAPADTPVIGAADVAAAVRVAGLKYSDAELAQMVGLAEGVRKGISAARVAAVDWQTDPAFRFDPLLPGETVPKGKNGCTVSRGALPNYDGHVGSLAFCTVTELSRLIKSRRVTSLELTQMYLSRLKKYGQALICVVNLCEDRALSQAKAMDKEIAAGIYRGPLHGIPWGAKDLLATKGIPTTFGAKPFEHQIFDIDATVVSRLDAAGAVLVAKLSMGELAMGDVWFAGKTRNPWNKEHGSSGSSAGPGSATAAGLVGFTIGTETLGSIVSPSVVNGVTGLRPTFGRVSRYGAMALSWTMDKIGPMCRCVEDCAVVFSAIHGPDGRDRTVVDAPFRWSPRKPLSSFKFGINEDAFTAAQKDAERGKAYAAALDTLKSLGVKLIPIKAPAGGDEFGTAAEITINAEGAASFVNLNLTGGLSELAQQGANNWPNLFRAGSITPAADYIHAMRLRHRLQEMWRDVMKDIDGFVTVPFAGPTLVHTNLTGHPTLITRCGLHDGMPQSIEFVGGLYREDAILRLGHAFECATAWHKQWPDMSKVA